MHYTLKWRNNLKHCKWKNENIFQKKINIEMSQENYYSSITSKNNQKKTIKLFLTKWIPVRDKEVSEGERGDIS